MSPEAREQMIETLQGVWTMLHREAAAELVDAFLSSPVMVDLVKAVETGLEHTIELANTSKATGEWLQNMKRDIEKMERALSPFKSGG